MPSWRPRMIRNLCGGIQLLHLLGILMVLIHLEDKTHFISCATEEAENVAALLFVSIDPGNSREHVLIVAVHRSGRAEELHLDINMAPT